MILPRPFLREEGSVPVRVPKKAIRAQPSPAVRQPVPRCRRPARVGGEGRATLAWLRALSCLRERTLAGLREQAASQHGPQKQRWQTLKSYRLRGDPVVSL